MPECDDCGTDARQVWRHRVFESETHRRLVWVCRSCHPDLSAARRAGGTPSTDGPGETADPVELRSDGGRSGAGVSVPLAEGATERRRCPVCLSETAGEGALLHCRECRWSGPR